MSEAKNTNRVLIVGLGKTGLSCARFYAARGIEVAITDSREQPPELFALKKELPDVAVFTGGFDQNAFDHADELVVSPGISLRHPMIANARSQGKQVLGDVEIFAQHAQAPILVVTGSNGKSTVTSLLGVMAREAGLDVRVGGNIGKPVLDLIEDTEPDCYVLELSSFQLEYTESLNASVATVLNISEDHMDRYDSLNDYIEAKRRVFNGDGRMVLNRDDEHVASMAVPDRNVIWFGLNNVPGADEYGVKQQDDGLWICKGKQALLNTSELLIPGMHNVSNVLAALAMGEAAGFDLNAMLTAVRGFKGLAHRTQFVRELEGVRWYNDSKGTNVGATLAALKGLPGPVVLIAGGEGKGADFAPLQAVVKEKARQVILFGRDAQLIEQALGGYNKISHATDLMDAVNQARQHARAGDSVLLSPACASFDMFENYQQRGELFADLVRGLS